MCAAGSRPRAAARVAQATDDSCECPPPPASSLSPKVIDITYANEAYKRMEKGDVKVCVWAGEGGHSPTVPAHCCPCGRTGSRAAAAPWLAVAPIGAAAQWRRAVLHCGLDAPELGPALQRRPSGAAAGCASARAQVQIQLPNLRAPPLSPPKYTVPLCHRHQQVPGHVSAAPRARLQPRRAAPPRAGRARRPPDPSSLCGRSQPQPLPTAKRCCPAIACASAS